MIFFLLFCCTISSTSHSCSTAIVYVIVGSSSIPASSFCKGVTEAAVSEPAFR